MKKRDRPNGKATPFFPGDKIIWNTKTGLIRAEGADGIGLTFYGKNGATSPRQHSLKLNFIKSLSDFTEFCETLAYVYECSLDGKGVLVDNDVEDWIITFA